MSKKRQLKHERTHLSQGEARIYRQKHWPHHYKVRLSGDLLAPFNAEPLNAADYVSLDGAGDAARFSPESLALPNWALSLQTVTLDLIRETAQTSDGVSVLVAAVIEFHIIERRSLIVEMIRDGKFKALGSVFANRCRAAIASEIGRMHYGQAIEHQGDNCTSLKDALNRSVNDLVNPDADGLGIEVTSANLKVEAKHESGETAHGPASRADFDLPNKARRILRFLRDSEPTAAELAWVERQLDRLIELESRRVIASGQATVVFVDGHATATADMNAADFMALAQSDRVKEMPNPDPAPPLVDLRKEPLEPAE